MILADFHVHSVASHDAFSTVTEICSAASRRGLEWVAVTDHGPAMPIGQHAYHFAAMSVLPNTIRGVRLLKGVEANILPDGCLDIDTELAEVMDIVIAAYHSTLWTYGSKAENTSKLVALLDSGVVDILAHPYHPWVEFELDAVFEVMAKNNVALELNEKALALAKHEHVAPLLIGARDHGLLFTLGSDAHYHTDVGGFSTCLDIIRTYSIPMAQIINYDRIKICSLAERRCKP